MAKKKTTTGSGSKQRSVKGKRRRRTGWRGRYAYLIGVNVSLCYYKRDWDQPVRERSLLRKLRVATTKTVRVSPIQVLQVSLMLKAHLRSRAMKQAQVAARRLPLLLQLSNGPHTLEA
ncbi:hypothetical protein PR002_g32934 [Phytophthora rubi]|uniref:Uncharacterized protein n=1 Tax=Phytophthora rubi TaxID=129364 RepID=A0A6A3FZL1_9STRA|nr:hypothetical protein PR002_g32934 [Phytophthora rubi]